MAQLIAGQHDQTSGNALGDLGDNELFTPIGIALSADSRWLYIADYSNKRVVKVDLEDPDRAMSLIATFSHNPTFIDVGPVSGDLYVATNGQDGTLDTGIYRVDPDSGATTLLANARRPYGIAVDATETTLLITTNGGFYFGNWWAARVFVMSTAGGALSEIQTDDVFIGYAGAQAAPDGGWYYVASAIRGNNGGGLYYITPDLSTVTRINYWPNSPTGFPSSAADLFIYDDNGTDKILIASGNGQIIRGDISPTGMTNPVTIGTVSPKGISVVQDNNKRVYVSVDPAINDNNNVGYSAISSTSGNQVVRLGGMFWVLDAAGI